MVGTKQIPTGLEGLHHDSPHIGEPYVYTTIRWDPQLVNSDDNTAASCNRPCPFYLLEHHYTRLQIAKWSAGYDHVQQASTARIRGPAYLLQGLTSVVNQWFESRPGRQADSLRIKLRCYATGKISSEVIPVPQRPLEAFFPPTLGVPGQHALLEASRVEWTVVVNNHPTNPGQSTMFKTSDRVCYARAREAMHINQAHDNRREVLLWNTDQHILDGAISTPYFYRRGRWVTPAASCGGLQGTTRRWALEKGIVIEGNIEKDRMVHGEIVWLSNAMYGYFAARYIAPEHDVALTNATAEPKVVDSPPRQTRAGVTEPRTPVQENHSVSNGSSVNVCWTPEVEDVEHH